jgi:hypothetical protein
MIYLGLETDDLPKTSVEIENTWIPSYIFKAQCLII